ncbi:hypothetical protein HY468_04885 [Candidatus Roizmanbacteria bacterium]|nr:hypothetical protein [Candidatus Roizmanbacteria bacterium]
MKQQSTQPSTPPQLPQSPKPSSNHKLLKIILLVIGFLLIAVIGASAYLGYQVNQEVVDVAITQLPVQYPKPDTTTEWTTFTNTKHRYSFQYKPTESLKVFGCSERTPLQEGEDYIVFAIKNSTFGCGVGGYVYPIIITEGQAFECQTDENWQAVESDIQVAGDNAKRCTKRFVGDTNTYFPPYFLDKVVVSRDNGAFYYLELREEQYEDTFSQILSTFRFVEEGEVDMTGWKTYTSKYGYSLQYPKEWEVKTGNWKEGSLQYGLQPDEEIALRYSEPNQPPHGGFAYGIAVNLVIPKDNPENLSPNEWAKKTLTLSLNGTPVVDETTSTTKTIIVGGIEALKVTTFFNGKSNTIFIPYKNKMYLIRSSVFTTEEKLVNYENIINQILSTFQFTE